MSMTTPDRCHEYANEIAGLRRELAAAQAAQRASVARIDELLRDIEQLRGEVILWIEASYAGTKLINEQSAEIKRLRRAVQQ